MGRVLLCLGKRATTPYYFQSAGMKVYSVEELCYFFGENAFLLDEDVVTKNLVDWIAKECALQELADAMYPFVGKEGAISYFVDLLFNYTGCFSNEYKEQVFEAVKQSAGQSVGERRKAKADFLMKSGKYELAVNEYYLILEQQKISDELLANIYQGLGRAYIHLFLLEGGTEMLERAYLMKRDEESAFEFLCAKRLQRKDSDYIAYIANHPELYDASMLVEQKLTESEKLWEVSNEKQKLEELKACKGMGNAGLYYSEVDRITAKLKEEYRKCAQE